jgi:hypothetical protein
LTLCQSRIAHPWLYKQDNLLVRIFAVARLIRAVPVFNLQRGYKASLAAEYIAADNIV